MADSDSTAGTCPECGATISRARVIIEYETADGPAKFAACAACDAVVHPDA